MYTPYAPEAPIGAPIHKLSAVLQASGEAIYTDDMPRAQSGLQVCDSIMVDLCPRFYLTRLV